MRSPSIRSEVSRIVAEGTSPPPPVIVSPGRAVRSPGRWSSGGSLVSVVPAGQTTGLPSSRTQLLSGSSSSIPPMSAVISAPFPSTERLSKPPEGVSAAKRSQPASTRIAEAIDTSRAPVAAYGDLTPPIRPSVLDALPPARVHGQAITPWPTPTAPRMGRRRRRGLIRRLRRTSNRLRRSTESSRDADVVREARPHVVS